MNLVVVKRLPGQDIYKLMENENTVLSVRYKPELHTARVESEKGQRILIIDNEGLLRNKKAIKNEYGVKIGSLHFDNFSDHSGVIEFDNSKYKFDIVKQPVSELHIYNHSKSKLIYKCNIAIDKSNDELSNDQNSSFLIAVSWYLFVSSKSKKELAFVA